MVQFQSALDSAREICALHLHIELYILHVWYTRHICQLELGCHPDDLASLWLSGHHIRRHVLEDIFNGVGGVQKGQGGGAVSLALR